MNTQINSKNRFEPDFNNLLAVLNKKKSSRPVLFEMAISDQILLKLAGKDIIPSFDSLDYFKLLISALLAAGYDYIPISGWRTNTLSFPKGDVESKSTKSLNEGALITDRSSFENYNWPDASIGNYEIFEKIGKLLPSGMKLIPSGNGGVLENVIELVGYENLCFMSMMDEELTKLIFDSVGSRLVKYYEIISQFDFVGACISNDDWGFKTQTMFSPDMLRKFVFPWHKKIVETIHKNNKPVILHSCGNLKDVMDDIINDLKYDGKHSFEDQILPVEQVYKIWGERIAIMGGIDMDFLARKSPSEIYERSKNMLVNSDIIGSYALGSGNSVPDYIPYENYISMVKAAREF
jgi:uroporphyrinogen decarboxylase